MLCRHHLWLPLSLKTLPFLSDTFHTPTHHTYPPCLTPLCETGQFDHAVLREEYESKWRSMDLKVVVIRAKGGASDPPSSAPARSSGTTSSSAGGPSSVAFGDVPWPLPPSTLLLSLSSPSSSPPTPSVIIKEDLAEVGVDKECDQDAIPQNKSPLKGVSVRPCPHPSHRRSSFGVQQDHLKSSPDSGPRS